MTQLPNKTAIELAEDLAQRLLVNGLLNEKHIETDFALVIKYITKILAPHIATESKIKAAAKEITEQRMLGAGADKWLTEIITRHLSAGGE